MNTSFYKDREGNLIPIPVSNNQILDKMFAHGVTRGLLKLASSRWYSNVQRMFLNSFFSTAMISGFVKKNGICLKEYRKKRYTSFHDFFLRELKPGKRPMEISKGTLISPCDCKASVYPINEDSCFDIKGVPYTVEEVLDNRRLARAYQGGYFYLLRLCVEDYHHYVYPVNGYKTADVKIPGKLYTVNPMIHRYAKVYRENARTYTRIRRPGREEVLVMEVGALGVGRIANDIPGECMVRAGEEKGHFEFGGSTVLVLVKKGSYVPRADLLKNTEDGYETIVKLGEGIGYEHD